jgi:2-oxo-4-hydroxy-4-carboxy-5-ureidoimidazoline decarboxylase
MPSDCEKQVYLRSNEEAPNSNVQAPEKHQISSSQTAPLPAWNLQLGISLELGAWNLGFQQPFAVIHLQQLNSFSKDDFVRTIAPLFEHSPWIAERTWLKRPFASFADLHGALCRTVRDAREKQQLSLIRAHPDLVGRAAAAGKLTRESTNEQASAGLNQLTPEEIEIFRQRNAAYREKFGFPFVICARLNKKAEVLAGFDRRLGNSREQEIKTALDEIFKIAELRLRDLTQT